MMSGMQELFILLGVLAIYLVVPIGILAILFTLRRPRTLHHKNPKLTACSDCEGSVSLRATTCPHCGAPLKATG